MLANKYFTNANTYQGKILSMLGVVVEWCRGAACWSRLMSFFKAAILQFPALLGFPFSSTNTVGGT